MSRHTVALPLLSLLSGVALAEVPTGTQAPAVTLTDVNPLSPTVGMTVGPPDARGVMSVWYFVGPQEAAKTQVPPLAKLGSNLIDDGIDVEVYFVLAQDSADGIPEIAKKKQAFILLDSSGAMANAWGAREGDLLIVDAKGRTRDVITLAEHDLNLPVNHADLEARLEGFAFDDSNVARLESATSH